VNGTVIAIFDCTLDGKGWRITQLRFALLGRGGKADDTLVLASIVAERRGSDDGPAVLYAVGYQEHGAFALAPQAFAAHRGGGAAQCGQRVHYCGRM
jgi:hypothetical protein